MFKIKSYILILLLAVVAGCNGDIFVEPVPDMVDNIKLSGYGDAARFKLPMDGLMSVKFDNETDYYTYTYYYDANGEPTDNLAEVRKIVYGSPRFMIEFNVDGEDVEVRSIANTYTSNLIMWANLDYGYMTRSVDIVITPGAPMETKECSYFMDSGQSGTTKIQGLRQRFTNNTDRSQRLVYYPYKEGRSIIEVVSEDHVFEGVKATVPVPLYSKGEWREDDENTAEIVVGSTSYFYSAGVDVGEEAYVDVPPQSTVTVNLTVEYATLDVKAWMVFNLPDTDMEWIVLNPCKIFQPVGYDLEMICED